MVYIPILEIAFSDESLLPFNVQENTDESKIVRYPWD